MRLSPISSLLPAFVLSFVVLCAPLPALADCDKAATQTDMNICSYDHYKAADAELNRLYRTKMRALTAPGSKERLKAAERAWVAFRDASCLYEVGPREESGTIWPLLMNSCMLRLTRERIAAMQEYVECTRGEDFCPQ